MDSTDKITFSCPSCGRELRIAKSHAGKKARCPKCQRILETPSSDAPVLNIAEPPAPGEDSPLPVQPAIPDANHAPVAAPPPTALDSPDIPLTISELETPEEPPPEENPPARFPPVRILASPHWERELLRHLGAVLLAAAAVLAIVNLVLAILILASAESKYIWWVAIPMLFSFVALPLFGLFIFTLCRYLIAIDDRIRNLQKALGNPPTSASRE
jgi:DNA-directed RNA polymerase subunit RPC12/RpoP